MEHNWIEKLPRHIQLHESALDFALKEFLFELWNEEEAKRVAELPDAIGWSLDDERFHRLMLRKLLRKPWWKRREICGSQWPDESRRRLYVQILGGLSRARSPQLFRGSPRRWADWVEGLIIQPVEKPVVGIPSVELVAYLPTTRGYCEWLSLGGDPDLGRYLGMYYEKYVLQKEFVIFDPDAPLENEPQ